MSAQQFQPTNLRIVVTVNTEGGKQTVQTGFVCDKAGSGKDVFASVYSRSLHEKTPPMRRPPEAPAAAG